MNCSLPPPLTDLQLLAHLEGEGDATIEKHLARCPACQERMAQMAHLDQQLTALLYRVTCPTAHTLGEYRLDLLPEQERATVAAHLAICPHCQEEDRQFQTFLASLADDTAYSPIQQVRVWVAELLSGGRASGPGSPALAGVRGDAGEPTVYQAGDAQIIIDSQADAGQAGQWVILGLVTGIEVAGAEITLQQVDEKGSALEARPPTTAQIDELGNFVFAPLSPGRYDIFIQIEGAEEQERQEIQIRDLQVGDLQP